MKTINPLDLSASWTLLLLILIIFLLVSSGHRLKTAYAGLTGKGVV